MRVRRRRARPPTPPRRGTPERDIPGLLAPTHTPQLNLYAHLSLSPVHKVLSSVRTTTEVVNVELKEVGRSYEVDCISFVQRIEEMLNEYRTFTLEQMYLAAVQRETAEKSAGWLAGMLAEYLKEQRHVTV